MKKLTYIAVLVIFLTILFYAFYPTENSHLKWRKFDEGLNEAKISNKKIIVDIYADWCKWCKKMDVEIYPSPEIKNYIETHYIPIKLNGESHEILYYKGEKYTYTEFTSSLGVNGFPATLFMETNGEIITILPGYPGKEEFLNILKFIGEDYYLKITFDEFLKKFK